MGGKVYSWDGHNCYDLDGEVPANNIASASYTGILIEPYVSVLADCPTNCQRLKFTGTCYKRCKARGWGVEQPVYGYGYGGYGGYPGYGYGGYPGYGYGGYGGVYCGYEGIYGGYGGYG